MKTLCITLFLSAFLGGSVANAQIDLHNHLDMHPGMTYFLHGDFFEAAKAMSWTSRLSTKASSLSLDPLHAPKLIVVALYAHPLLSYFENPDASLLHFDSIANMQVALDHEYEHITTFVKEHRDHFGIARNPAQAEEILKQKKTVIVFSIEGAAGALETEGDFKKWIDERGIAIVTPFHLTEDHFSGPALMPNKIAFFNAPMDFIRSVLVTGGECFQHFCRSTVGIKPDGQALIERLLARRVWIDLAHANDMSVQELLPTFEKLQLPLLVTHTEFRDFYSAERGIGTYALNYLKKQDGIIGILPSLDMVNEIPASLAIERCADGKFSGLELFRAIMAEAFAKLGAERVAMGSDANAPISGLSPACHAKSRGDVSELEEKGFYTYTQWNALSNYVAASPQWNDLILAHFLKEWARVRPTTMVAQKTK